VKKEQLGRKREDSNDEKSVMEISIKKRLRVENFFYTMPNTKLTPVQTSSVNYRTITTHVQKE
jgi:hypothetical protein